MDQKVTTQTALSNKNYVIVGYFSAHAPFGENWCASVTCNRLVENIVDSSLCMLNDSRITRIPDVSTQSNCCRSFSCFTWSSSELYTIYRRRLFGKWSSSHYNRFKWEYKRWARRRGNISKFQYKHADWEAYQAFLLSSDINSVVNDDMDIFYSNFNQDNIISSSKLPSPELNIRK